MAHALLLCVSAAAASALPPLPLPGAGAWTYDAKGGQPAEWSSGIAQFNKRAHQPLSLIFSYGGDMECALVGVLLCGSLLLTRLLLFHTHSSSSPWQPSRFPRPITHTPSPTVAGYPALPTPGQTYFPADSQAAASAYAATPGVNYVSVVIDGRMDGGESYSPDLSRLSHAQLLAWASDTAALYCSVDAVDGIQLDLEPYEGKYKAPFLVFLGALAANLRSAERNCVSATHPHGRSITTFVFAGSIGPEMWAALGPNGYVTVSGYDLSDAPAGTPSSVAQYARALNASLVAVAASANAHNGSYFVGIPGAASAHEFETYTFANGTVVRGTLQLEFVQAALEALDAHAATSPGFLGPALWGFAPVMAFPPHSGNVFAPDTPFVSAGEEAFLEANLRAAVVVRRPNDA